MYIVCISGLLSIICVYFVSGFIIMFKVCLDVLGVVGISSLDSSETDD